MEKWLYNDRENGIYSVLGNEKTLNELYFSTVGKGNYHLSPTQQSVVLSIANQCPYTGGEAVYRARAMRLLFEPEYQYSDSVVCGLQNIGWRKKGNPTKEKTIQHWVIPNPTNDNVLIQLSSRVKENTECRIYDIQGRLIEVVPVSAQDTQIRVSMKSCASGVYYYKIAIAESTIEGKIVLIH